jgi:hypothetical protein
MKMNIKTIRATANNLITALEFKRAQNERLLQYEVAHMYEEGHDIKTRINLVNDMEKECKNAMSILSMLYITCNDNYEKYMDELNQKQDRVWALRDGLNQYI